MGILLVRPHKVIQCIGRCRLVTVAGVYRRRLSSSVTLHGRFAGGFSHAGQATTSCRLLSNYSSTATLHGGPVRLRPVRATPCFTAGASTPVLQGSVLTTGVIGPSTLVSGWTPVLMNRVHGRRFEVPANTGRLDGAVITVVKRYMCTRVNMARQDG